MVCSPERSCQQFIEVIFSRDVPLSEIHEIRVAKGTHHAFVGAMAEALAGVLPAEQQVEQEGLIRIFELLDRRGLRSLLKEV